MEKAASNKPTLGKSTSVSSSFKLRSPSLNAIRLRRIFDLFDKNGDGVITFQELSQALIRLGLSDSDLSDLETMVNSYVKPGCTGLQFEDFESLHQALNDTYFGLVDDKDEKERDGVESQQVNEDLSEAFKVFDEDGDGYISARELQVVLEKLGLAEANEFQRVQQMIISVDMNKDGLVDFHEFKNMMGSVAAVPS